MLDVLLGEDVHNACVVVTRYFGGTLLGTGGLVRAYSGAVKEGLAASEIVEKKRAFEMKIVTDYTGIGKIQYILGQENMTVLDSVYTDKVEFFRLLAAWCGVRWPGKEDHRGDKRRREDREGR